MAFEGIPFEHGKHFQCPYCFMEQIVKNKAAWKKHVFRDLRPYVCTFKECNLKMFRSRNEWFIHELRNHRRHWICVLCATSFNYRKVFSEHLEIKHHVSTSDPQFGALILQSEEAVDTIPEDACPFCDEWEETLVDPKQDARRAFLNDGQDVKPYGTLKQFRRHLGRHMEQLALFALPMTENEDLEDDSASGHSEDSVNTASIQVYNGDDDDGGGETFALHDDIVGNAILPGEQNSKGEEIQDLQSQTRDKSPGTSSLGSMANNAGQGSLSYDTRTFPDNPQPTMMHDPHQAQDDNSIQHHRYPSPPPPLGENLYNPQTAVAKNADLEFEASASDRRAHIDTERSDEEFQNQAERPQEYSNLLTEYLRKTGMNEEEIQLVLKQDHPDGTKYTRIARKHLSLETLNQHHLKYEFDADPDYRLIKRWVSEYEQDFLWKDTKELRQKRAQKNTGRATTSAISSSQSFEELRAEYDRSQPTHQQSTIFCIECGQTLSSVLTNSTICSTCKTPVATWRDETSKTFRTNRQSILPDPSPTSKSSLSIIASLEPGMYSTTFEAQGKATESATASGLESADVKFALATIAHDHLQERGETEVEASPKGTRSAVE